MACRRTILECYILACHILPNDNPRMPHPAKGAGVMWRRMQHRLVTQAHTDQLWHDVARPWSDVDRYFVDVARPWSDVDRYFVDVDRWLGPVSTDRCLSLGLWSDVEQDEAEDTAPTRSEAGTELRPLAYHLQRRDFR